MKSNRVKVAECCSRIVHKHMVMIDVMFCRQVAYTFDAGPNACLYLMEDMVPTMLGLVQNYFPPEQDHGEAFLTGLPSKVSSPAQVGVLNNVTFLMVRYGYHVNFWMHKLHLWFNYFL